MANEPLGKLGAKLGLGRILNRIGKISRRNGKQEGNFSSISYHPGYSRLLSIFSPRHESTNIILGKVRLIYALCRLTLKRSIHDGFHCC